MRLLELHTCPAWEYPSGIRVPGFYHDENHPPAVGWCNVAVIRIGNATHNFLLTLQATEQ